jgi:aerobic-type carbon monoxide dehydrogenase small subunit (CoxS/CutS family)
MRVGCTINGEPVRRNVDADALLLDVLRDELGLTGTKWGCRTGDCGACTVLVDGEPRLACLQLVSQLDGRAVTTIEGLGTHGAEDGDVLSDLQAAFVRHGATQCGFCTPGMILAAEALLSAAPTADESEIRTGLAGNLCRCTGYEKIVDAVLEVVTSRRASDAPAR